MKTEKIRPTAEGMPKATVPFPGHSPLEEMDEALSYLRTLRNAVIAASQGIVDTKTVDIETMIAAALAHLEPIHAFFEANEVTGNDLPFLECRREWFARKGGAK